jgi:hypothetical protein
VIKETGWEGRKGRREGKVRKEGRKGGKRKREGSLDLDRDGD